MKIEQIFSDENFNDPLKIDWLKQEAGFFLKIMETQTGDVPAEREAPVVSPSALELFFRHKERSEKVCQIMQYLLAFLSHIPDKSELLGEPVDPTEQFREFIRYETDLLLEEDVKNAVFHESNQRSPAHGVNIWDTQGRIIAMNRGLRQLVARQEREVTGTLANLCRVLEELCLFWFEIRRHDIRRTRRSDIYLYLLARLVQHRCRKARNLTNPLNI
jgi:PAS domain-containing protein